MSNCDCGRELTWDDKKQEEERLTALIAKAKAEIYEKEVNIKIWAAQKERVWK